MKQTTIEGRAYSPEQVIEKLKQGNDLYINNQQNPSDISKYRREATANNGQTPYAVIITCSDSRVPPEHIFSHCCHGT